MEGPHQNLTSGSDSEYEYSMFYLSYNLFTLSNDSSNETTTVALTSTDNLVKFLVLGVGLSLITILGIIGNVFSIAVLFHKRMRSSISCFLIGLAICDMMTLATSLVMIGFPIFLSFEPLYPGLTSVYLVIGKVVPYTYAGSITALTGSVYFTIAVTLERYIVVCHPFLARRICNWKRACQVSVVIIVLSILYNIPRWFNFTCETVYDDDGTSIGCRVKATEFRKDPTYNYYYTFLSLAIINNWIPIIVLFVFNLLIYVKIRQANKDRKNLSMSESKDNSLTYMLFIVVGVFFVCNSPVAFGVIYKLFIWGRPPPPPNPMAAFIIIFLIVLNSSLNFIIYCTYGEKFREVFLQMIAQPWRRLTRSRSESNFSSENSCKSKRFTCSSSKTPSSQSIQTICETV